ncbi:hypothetical protein OESDEN_04968 [Oesophagostomum dentatum]|uniref:Uncharacterized protein n=1 Tax=Oesophagostomum dentatum TaxID=61180 RepID=A0A0B1TC16_OESDE|nr:hypothetical protein OESDEN_04968 [Oesophagostomum dentatum]
MMLIMYCQILFCIIAPYSSLAEQFFSDGRYTFAQREARLWVVLIISGFFTFVAGWFLSIALATYQYFEFINAKKARKAARHEQARSKTMILISHKIGAKEASTMVLFGFHVKKSPADGNV